MVNLTIGLSTQSLLSASNADRLLVDGCTFSGAGADGVAIAGRRSTLRRSEVGQLGGQGLEAGLVRRLSRSLVVGGFRQLGLRGRVRARERSGVCGRR